MRLESIVISMLRHSRGVFAKKWQSLQNGLFTHPEYGWVAVAIAYMAILLLFTHIDLVDSHLRAESQRGLLGSAICKHSGYLTFIINMGLMFFLFIDIRLAHDRHISKFSTVIIVMLSLFFCGSAMCFSLGFINSNMGKYAVMYCGLGALFSWCYFFCILVFLKHLALK